MVDADTLLNDRPRSIGLVDRRRTLRARYKELILTSAVPEWSHGHQLSRIPAWTI